MREGDYSIRGRGAREDDALGEVMIQVNAIGATLRDQRLGAVEATALLSKVMEEIEVAVFTFDAEERLRFINRAGERLLDRTGPHLLGQIGRIARHRATCCTWSPRSRSRARFPAVPAAGASGAPRSAKAGCPNTLLVLTDLTRALREEELQAWQRLVRVLGHELNNSLTPIKSIAGSLTQILIRQPRPDDWEDDMRDGLTVIASRSEALSRFIGAYSRLAKLPRPRLAPVDLGALVQRVVGLETRLEIRLMPGPKVMLRADADQLEQLLINLLRNAVDASLETGGGVTVAWSEDGRAVSLVVLDEGLGLSNTTNLFVPFFTTKPGGSGIGLVLSRQIAEAHGGSLSLANRDGVRGCQAKLSLPL